MLDETAAKTLTPDGSVQVEIVGTTEVPGGVEVLAKAWTYDGRPIGFGEDGSVEVERFRILNPPTKVPTGTFHIEQDAEGKDIEVADYVTNVAAAKLRVLEQAVALKRQRQEGGANIQPGKVGNTTTIVYADAGDGHIIANSGVWATVRGATSGSATTNETSANVQPGENIAGTYYLDRAFFDFDTSGVPDADVASAVTFSVYAGASGSDVDTIAWTTLQATPATHGALVGGDFDQCGAVEGASRFTEASVTDNAYQDIGLNATGLTWLDQAGWTTLCFRSDNDLDNVAPTGRNYRVWYFADAAGTTNDPKLTIEHAGSDGSGGAVVASGTNTEVYQLEAQNFILGWALILGAGTLGYLFAREIWK